MIVKMFSAGLIPASFFPKLILKKEIVLSELRPALFKRGNCWKFLSGQELNACAAAGGKVFPYYIVINYFF